MQVILNVGILKTSEFVLFKFRLHSKGQIFCTLKIDSASCIISGSVYMQVMLKMITIYMRRVILYVN